MNLTAEAANQKICSKFVDRLCLQSAEIRMCSQLTRRCFLEVAWCSEDSKQGFNKADTYLPRHHGYIQLLTTQAINTQQRKPLTKKAIKMLVT